MTNFTKDDFHFGDIVATRSSSFLSRGIRWFMRRSNKSYIGEDFSHIAVVINVWGEKYIGEALGWGVRIWSIEDSGYLKKEQVVVLRHCGGFRDDQIERLSKKCISLGGIRYQYENLPQWMLKILFKIKVFKPSNEKAIYCSELGAICINEAYPGMFKYPNMTSPADHYRSFLYEKIDKNHLLW